MKSATYRVVIILLWFVLASCGREVNPDEPPEIIYGRDACARCNMIINEERFAAAYWTVSGEARRFDDIGGMLAYHQEKSEEVAAFWVHDYESGDWLRADDAFFVLGSDLMTPMGFGISAYASEAEADALAAKHEGATVLEFDALLEQLSAGTLHLDPMHEHDE